MLFTSYLNVFAKVADASCSARSFQVIVDPAQEDLFRWKSDQVLNFLAVIQQDGQSWVMSNVDVTQQTNLYRQNEDSLLRMLE